MRAKVDSELIDRVILQEMSLVELYGKIISWKENDGDLALFVQIANHHKGIVAEMLDLTAQANGDGYLPGANLFDKESFDVRDLSSLRGRALIEALLAKERQLRQALVRVTLQPSPYKWNEAIEKNLLPRVSQIIAWLTEALLSLKQCEGSAITSQEA